MYVGMVSTPYLCDSNGCVDARHLDCHYCIAYTYLAGLESFSSSPGVWTETSLNTCSVAFLIPITDLVASSSALNGAVLEAWVPGVEAVLFLALTASVFALSLTTTVV